MSNVLLFIVRITTVGLFIGCITLLDKLGSSTLAYPNSSGLNLTMRIPLIEQRNDRRTLGSRNGFIVVVRGQKATEFKFKMSN